MPAESTWTCGGASLVVPTVIRGGIWRKANIRVRAPARSMQVLSQDNRGIVPIQSTS
jgi:hypothetical protein